MSDEEAGAAMAGMILVVAGIGCVIGLAIQVFICWLLSGWLKRIPAEHRKQEPGMVWLLLIPLFSIVWNFFVYPRIAESFDSYFKSKSEPAESAAGSANLYCWGGVAAVLIGWVPIVGGLVGIAMLILWILVLVKFAGLAKRLPPAAA